MSSIFYASPGGPFIRKLRVRAGNTFPNMPYILEQKDGLIRSYSRNGAVSDWSPPSDGFTAFCNQAIKNGIYVAIPFPSDFSSSGLSSLEFPE